MHQRVARMLSSIILLLFVVQVTASCTVFVQPLEPTATQRPTLANQALACTNTIAPATHTPLPTWTHTPAPSVTPTVAKSLATATAFPETATPTASQTSLATPSATPSPPSPASPTAAASPTQTTAPTATTMPTAAQDIERLSFQQGDRVTVIEEIVPGSHQGSKRYAVRAYAGQAMTVTLESEQDVYLGVESAGGDILQASDEGEQSWCGELPITDDYSLEPALGNGVRQASYTLTVVLGPLELPEAKRIVFSPGNQSGTLTGSLENKDLVRYALRAEAGKRLSLRCEPTGKVHLALLGRDGHLWSAPQGISELVIERLPKNQDYYLILAPLPGETISQYRLEIALEVGD